MEAGAFERVYQAFQEFHTYFAGAFCRKQWWEHSRHYLQGLLVQSQERRNAENLSEMVPVSAGSMQRFLTDAHFLALTSVGDSRERSGCRVRFCLGRQ